MNIYNLYTTNEHKNTDYNREFWCGTNFKKLLDVIYKGILGGTFEWTRYGDDLAREDQAQDFLDDMDIPLQSDKIKEIQTHLDYAYLSVVKANTYA